MKTAELKPIVADRNLIAYCGLYCGACRSYLKGSCPGCRDNVKATWCKIRQCCQEKKLASCADCSAIKLQDCNKYNTFISKVIGVILNSNRTACIHRIEEIGYERFAIEMTENNKQTIRRK